jgi:hypothetical protein
MVLCSALEIIAFQSQATPMVPLIAAFTSQHVAVSFTTTNAITTLNVCVNWFTVEEQDLSKLCCQRNDSLQWKLTCPHIRLLQF